MRKPKVGIFVESFPVVSETFVFQKVKALLLHGYDVQVFTLKPSADWQKYHNEPFNINDLKNRIYCANVSDSLCKKIFRLIIQFIKHPLVVFRWIIFNVGVSKNESTSLEDKILNRLNFINAKVDILSIEFDTLGYKVVDLKPYLECKIVVNTRGVAQSTNTFRKCPKTLPLLNEYTNYICFASSFLRNNSYKLGMSSSIPNKVIYGSVSETFLHTAYNARAFKRPIKLLSVGRLAWSKGYEFNIDAVNKLLNEGYDVRYAIVGDGPYKDAIIKSLSYYDLLGKDIVTLVGIKDPNQIKDYLLDSDIFIQGSLSEGFGVSVLEAQFTGIPIVCSNAGGLAENINNNITGLLFHRRDSADMKEKIKILIESPEYANSIGHSAYLASRIRYNPKREITEIENVFKEIF